MTERKEQASCSTRNLLKVYDHLKAKKADSPSGISKATRVHYTAVCVAALCMEKLGLVTIITTEKGFAIIALK